ncbi:MAG: BTAD domain-containing putative transcriptional regulator [Anaerolineae bacterium]
MLEIALFGPLRLSHDGAPLPPPALPRTLPLLAYLLLNRDRPIPRAALAFALWPDVPEAEARANLRRHVHALDAALPAAPPTARGSCAPARRCAGTRMPTRAWTSPRSRTAWRRAAPPRSPRRSRPTARTFCPTSTTTGPAPSASGCGSCTSRPSASSSTTTRRPAISAPRSPLPSAASTSSRGRRAVRSLMALRFLAGDRTGAVMAYQALKRHLADELGVPPMPATNALFAEVVGGEMEARRPRRSRRRRSRPFARRPPRRSARGRRASPRRSHRSSAAPNCSTASAASSARPTPGRGS